MPATRRTLWLSLQAKVMLAVLAVLVTLPAITLWIINRRLSDQAQHDAELVLSTARQSFLQTLQVHSNGLVGRLRTAMRDQTFFKVLRLRDGPTMEAHLRDALEESHDDTELAIFVPLEGELRGARSSTAPVTVEAFAAAVDRFIQGAMRGNEMAGSLAVDRTAYYVVAMPVRPPEGLMGTLVFGIRITDAALRNVQPPASEILVLAGGAIAASTIKDPAQNGVVLLQLDSPDAKGPDGLIVVGGQRFKPITGELDPEPSSQGVTYLLLSSIEQRLAEFKRTRTALLGISGVGIVISAVVVWFFVRRITRPLVELRDSAEAIGRGDFSHRVERFSNDECGELAEAFNQMITDLQRSRAELERAMQQVKNTQDQLIQSEKLSAVGQFVAGVAHELNNPLTAVVGFSELLQTMGTDGQIRDYLVRIAKSAHRCHRIVQNLLSFARQHAPERKPVDLHASVDEVLDIMAYDLRTSNIKVTRDFAPHLSPILGDAHQLQQVFVNIIGNARQAMEPVPRDGTMLIRTRQQGEKVFLEFADNGPGIPPANVARVFDPFFTTKPIGKGTGLGLSLCYGIIQEHGGKISVRSEVGAGATFVIELPVDVTAEQTVAPAKNDGAVSPFPAGQAASSGKTVLVVDDEEWILDLARELLRAEGHAVETAAGGREALDLIKHRNYDVILTDWKMSGLSGVHLYENLCTTNPDAAKRVLFMTGDTVNESFQEFLRKHQLGCLAKPFARREFRAAVAKVTDAAALSGV